MIYVTVSFSIITSTTLAVVESRLVNIFHFLLRNNKISKLLIKVKIANSRTMTYLKL